MQANNATLEAIRSSLDGIQYTVEDIKLIADDILTSHREQHVKLQHVAVMAKHVVSICNFILSVSTTEGNNEHSIPTIVGNIILCCRKIDDIANTSGYVEDEDLLKLTYYINNIILLRNRIYTIMLIGNYKRQTNDKENIKQVQTNNNIRYSKHVRLNKISKFSIFQSDIEMIKYEFCTIQDYFKYLFLPKIMELTTIKTNMHDIESSAFHRRRMWRKVKYYTLLFKKLNSTLRQNTATESSNYTETNQSDFNDNTKHESYLDVVSFIYENSKIVSSSTDLSSTDSTTESYHIDPSTQGESTNSSDRVTIGPDFPIEQNTSDDQTQNIGNDEGSTTTLENSFKEVEYSEATTLYNSEDISPLAYNDPMANKEEAGTIQSSDDSFPTVHVLISNNEHFGVGKEETATTCNHEYSTPSTNYIEETSATGYSGSVYTTSSYDEASVTETTQLVEETSTTYINEDTPSTQDIEEASATGYSDSVYTTSSYDEPSVTETTQHVEETTTTFNNEVPPSTQDIEEATTATGYSDSIYTTSSYDEPSVTETTQHVEITTELDKYKLSQDIYNIAQDMYSKANEMSSVTSEISSKISDISNLLSDVNTDEDEIREKVQKLNRYTQELSSKTSEISSLSSEASRLSSDISSASQDIPSSEKVQSHRTTPWQKITQKSQDLITATQSIVTASQEVMMKSREVSTLSENLKPANAIANGIYDINSRTQGLITEALDIVTAVVEILTLVQL